MDARKRHPPERGVGVCQNRAPRATHVIQEFLRNSDQMPQRSLPIGKLQGCSVGLGVTAKRNTNRFYIWTLDFKTLIGRNRRIDSSNLRVSTNDRDEMSLCPPR